MGKFYLQEKLSGQEGQMVGFDATGNAVAVDAPNSLWLDSIAITTPPSKTAYKAGEVFNTAGMVVKAKYTNGTVIIAEDIVVTGWNVTPSGGLAAGTAYVTVQYTENGVTKTAQQAVSVTKTVVQVPYQSGSLTYTGGSQSPSWANYDSGKVNIGGTTNAINAGSYNASATLKDTELYCWPDQTTGAKSVSWSIAKAAGTLSLNKSSITLNPDALSATFQITTNSGGSISISNSRTDICSATRSGKTVTVTSIGGKSGDAAITVSVAGDSNHNAPASVTCTVRCSFVSIYGAQWDGTSTTTWSRTDDAAGFVNPVPAVSNGGGSSPFDGKMPWAGMVRVTDSAAGELVAIPKFWFKWTKSGNSLKLQIADGPVDGFMVSPAHQNRGDGKGERDTVYIGRYHCANGAGYKSQSGAQPQTNMTRSGARSSIHNLGGTIWQMDFAMRVTIWMLYLVEFADWNSQAKIGYGCSLSGSKWNMGYTDGMAYHTGTTAANRNTYGGTQYRYIEGLWDNVYDWMDGCYYNGSGLNIIKNPASFHDSANGTPVGTPVGGWTSALAVASAAGLEWAIYPTAASGSENTYTSDNWYFNASVPCLYVGGNYGQYQNLGLFCVGYGGASYSVAYVGCRLQKLP